jgi:shikimate dehydrogenase
MIDKDTKIYCSFSSNPGNNGCIFFNTAFKNKKINAIYKSFYSDNIKKSIDAVKVLGISGFAVSMPFKIEILEYVDEFSEEVNNIKSCNTVINENGKLIAYNTDYIAVMKYFQELKIKNKDIYIIGNGGFSKAVQYACKVLEFNYKIITRKNWYTIDQLENKFLFNATPLEINTKKNTLIDGRPFTNSGKKIAVYQSIEQFKLYTGVDYE